MMKRLCTFYEMHWSFIRNLFCGLLKEKNMESNSHDVFCSEAYFEEKKIIQDAMDKNNLIIFVGAGASKCAGMPLWGDAIEEIKHRLGVEFLRKLMN